MTIDRIFRVKTTCILRKLSTLYLILNHSFARTLSSRKIIKAYLKVSIDFSIKLQRHPISSRGQSGTVSLNKVP